METIPASAPDVKTASIVAPCPVDLLVLFLSLGPATSHEIMGATRLAQTWATFAPILNRASHLGLVRADVDDGHWLLTDPGCTYAVELTHQIGQRGAADGLADRLLYLLDEHEERGLHDIATDLDLALADAVALVAFAASDPGRVERLTTSGLYQLTSQGRARVKCLRGVKYLRERAVDFGASRVDGFSDKPLDVANPSQVDRVLLMLAAEAGSKTGRPDGMTVEEIAGELDNSCGETLSLIMYAAALHWVSSGPGGRYLLTKAGVDRVGPFDGAVVEPRGVIAALRQEAEGLRRAALQANIDRDDAERQLTELRAGTSDDIALIREHLCPADLPEASLQELLHYGLGDGEEGRAEPVLRAVSADLDFVAGLVSSVAEGAEVDADGLHGFLRRLVARVDTAIGLYRRAAKTTL